MRWWRVQPEEADPRVDTRTVPRRETWVKLAGLRIPLEADGIG